MHFDNDLIYSISARIVGAALLWTGIIKAVEPQTFQGHLSRLGWIPWKQLDVAVTASAAGEAALGVALVVRLLPQLTYPAAITALLAFSAITWFSIRTGKVDDCGCYGGYIQPSLVQSLAINLFFAAMIIIAWMLGPLDNGGTWWKVATVFVASAAVGIFCYYAQRFARKNGKQLIDRNPLKAGNRWNHRWANGSTAAMSDEFLVGLLGTECPYCGKFVRIANAMLESSALPKVVGLVAATESRASSYIEEKGIRFPVTRVSQSLMARLAPAVPTAVLVRGDRIEKVWVGDMPPDFVDRFLVAFFPEVETSRRSRIEQARGPAPTGK
jgi:hypothetical protein